MIISKDGIRTIAPRIGTLWAVYSTMELVLNRTLLKIPMAEAFLKTGVCEANDALETARQFNLLRDAFAAIPPEKAVYDMTNPKAKAPWDGNLSPVVTSCANLFTTEDGKDLLFEIVSILTHGAYTGTEIVIR